VSEVLFQSALKAAELIPERQVSSRELTHALLARIDAVNPNVNAVVELRAEAALEDAAAADGAPENTVTQPLHGVPITVKETFDVAGLHTTWGNPAFKEYVAENDATLVARLKDAGAIVVGKTNVHAMLADFAQTSNEVYGTTNNPWDVSRTPGGSSGGAAAALAAGLKFLDDGSDLVGSIRIPASFCGVYGLKPSDATATG
jgi:amidase